MGIITEITLSCVENYKLKLDKFSEKLPEVLSNLNDYNYNNRNFEFLWFPYTDTTLTKYSNITNFKADRSNFYNFVNDYVIENYFFNILGKIVKWFPKTSVAMSKFSTKFLFESVRIKEYEDIYVLPRKFKFNEMEYCVSTSVYNDVMKDIVKLVNTKKFNVAFPIQSRFVAKDDIYLSPSYQRDSAYIACHVFKGKDYHNYFKALEEIFTAYEGRPHWGKIHYKKSDYFRKVYPMFEKFIQKREECDPNNIFLNEYLKEILL